MEKQQRAYKRVLLKLSGESLLGEQAYGISEVMMDNYVTQIKHLVEVQAVELAIVIGGGNIFRGMQRGNHISRTQGDYMGMLATIMNGLALQSALENAGVITRLSSAIEMQRICEPYIRRRAIRHLDKGRVVIFCAGTGHPFFTTDTAAALRAVEMNAEVLLKATRVDGIYSADPEVDATATRYDKISYRNALQKGLKVMDLTAFSLCAENNMPIVVFDINQKDNLKDIIAGNTAIGTLVTTEAALAKAE